MITCQNNPYYPLFEAKIKYINDNEQRLSRKQKDQEYQQLFIIESDMIRHVRNHGKRNDKFEPQLVLNRYQ